MDEKKQKYIERWHLKKWKVGDWKPDANNKTGRKVRSYCQWPTGTLNNLNRLNIKFDYSMKKLTNIFGWLAVSFILPFSLIFVTSNYSGKMSSLMTWRRIKTAVINLGDVLKVDKQLSLFVHPWLLVCVSVWIFHIGWGHARQFHCFSFFLVSLLAALLALEFSWENNLKLGASEYIKNKRIHNFPTKSSCHILNGIFGSYHATEQSVLS